MERLDMAETLARKAGVNLKDARDALARENWDMLDAMLLLRRESGARAGKKGEADVDNGKAQGDAGWLSKAIAWIGDMVARGSRCFVSVSRDGKPRFEVTVTIAVLLALVLHGFFLFGVAVMLLMGYRFSFISEARDREMRRDVDEAAQAAREVQDRSAVNSLGGNA
ncbi:MAG TPA: hypothetical protein VLA21_01755 [Candidatus Limnocylindria bacterium]|nr:hypothetical protein [Candidatus Limnocylindria bacterium]